MKDFILRGDEFDIGFQKALSSKNFKYFSNWFNEESRREKLNEFSYRVLSHWEKEGIISTKRKEGTGWRKFSVVELIWLHVIKELRSFDFSIASIMRTRESLFPLKSGKQYSSLFEFYLMLAYMRIPVILVIFAEGRGLPATYDQYCYSRMMGALVSNHIIVDINSIFSHLFPSIKLSPQYEYKDILMNPKEIQLIYQIRSARYKSILIKLNNGEINLIQKTEMIQKGTSTEEIASTVIKLLKEEKYQNILITQDNGKVQVIHREIKEK
jgi:hypothetical protein